MPNRTSAEQVRGIITFDPSIADLSPFIEAANEMVTEVCANAANTTGVNPGYTPRRLELIERWLAAHFLAIRDPRYTSETMGQASASYQQQVGLNLSLTPYGQQAMLLDTAGGLAWIDKHISQGKRAKVGIVWLGTKQDKYYDYPWRFFGLFD